MPPQRSRQRPRPQAHLVALAAAVAWGGAARATPPDGPLLLEVRINGQPTNKIGDFVERGGRLCAKRKELRDLGLTVEGQGDDEAEVALADLPNIQLALDEQAQTLDIKTPLMGLKVTRLEPEAAADTPVSRTSPGLLFNYTASVQAGRDATGALAAGEARLFGSWGVASTTFTAAVLPGVDAFVRLDSTYTFSDSDALRRYRLGDVITGGLPWTRPVRLGGAQMAADFSMRPNLVTFPTPAISGQAAVPSTVDVLVNGMQALSREVPAGPFNVPHVPVVSGAGRIAVDVRDTAGNLSTQVLDFYVSPTLMKPGLSSFSVELGAVRRNYGLVSDDYGALAGSGTWRYGATSALTLSAHAEAARGLGLVEAGATGLLGDFGVLTLATGLSANGERDGELVYGAFSRETRVYSISLSVQAATASFEDVAGLNGSPPPRLVLQAGGGFSAGRFGNFGAVLAKVDGPVAPCGGCAPTVSGVLGGLPSAALQGPTAERATVASATYSTRIFGRFSLSASGYRDLERRTGGVLLSLSIPLGGRATATPSLARQGGYTEPSLQVSRPAVKPGDWGGQLYDVEGGPLTRRFGELEYRSPWAVVDAGIDSEGTATIGRATVSGALAVIDGGAFLSAPIQDSFAVVDTDGRPGVGVFVENQLAGRTNAAGRLLVPDLRSYNATRIGIDPADLDLDSQLAQPDLYRRPSDRAGLIVRFDIKSTEQALLTLVDARGAPIPVGSTAVLANSASSFPVGYDGQLLLTGLSRRNTLQVTLPNGQTCGVEFDYRRVKGEIARIGPFACKSGSMAARLGLRGPK